MTAAVCSLDLRPNKEAESKFHALRASGFDMNGLGALRAAREVPWFNMLWQNWGVENVSLKSLSLPCSLLRLRYGNGRARQISSFKATRQLA